MAWVLATSPDARIRDSAKAVALAEQANQTALAFADPTVEATLAAAYAEVGRFRKQSKPRSTRANWLSIPHWFRLRARLKLISSFIVPANPFRDIQ